MATFDYETGARNHRHTSSPELELHTFEKSELKWGKPPKRQRKETLLFLDKALGISG